MKPLKFSPDVYKKLKEIQLKNVTLHKRIQKQLYLFIKNPRHKSLRLHKIERRDSLSIWSISIDKSYRMLYKENEVIYFFGIGTHDEVYKRSLKASPKAELSGSAYKRARKVSL